mgnify:CR=1 FL=1
MRPCFIYFVLFFLLSCQSKTSDKVAEKSLQVAVASNFFAPMQVLAEQYTESTGIKINLSAGATGQLFTQIVQGAPFDVFLAADEARPLALEQQDLVVKDSRFTYVEGRLALWSLNPFKSESLEFMSFEHLAIANPKLAPYGAAAVEVLQHLGVYQTLLPHLVYGQNIAQAQQFVLAGQADAAIISLSQAKLWEAKTSQEQGLQKAYYQVLPSDYHSPIKQQAVVLTDNQSASAFMAYLRTDKAAKKLQAWGYEVDL